MLEYQNIEATGSISDQCDKSGQMSENMEGVKSHIEMDQALIDVSETQESILGLFSYESEMCEEVMDDTNYLQNHIETEHSQHLKCKLFDCEFLEDIAFWKHLENFAKSVTLILGGQRPKL